MLPVKFGFTPALLEQHAKKHLSMLSVCWDTRDFYTIPQVGILKDQSSHAPNQTNKQTNKRFPEILFSFGSMCSVVRVCATDVASENWIHSRATGAARKKTMNE